MIRNKVANSSTTPSSPLGRAKQRNSPQLLTAIKSIEPTKQARETSAT